MNIRTLLLIVFAVAALARAEMSITVYNNDIALVRESREVEFQKGIHEQRFTGVASKIIPTSVHFHSDRAELLEQNYDYDLVDSKKLMQKYIDKQVELYTLVNEGRGIFEGTLLSAMNDVVLQETDGSIRSISADKIFNVHFPALPEGLITRPTLVWLVEAPRDGKGDSEVTYLTRGMSWESEYVAVLNDEDDALDMTGWVNITNHSGATYKDAKVKLMAGDVQVVKPKRDFELYDVAMSARASAAPQFEEQSFYEYHLYTLQRPSTIKENQVKQISLFPTAEVKSVKKEYRYEGRPYRRGTESDDVRVTLKYENTKNNGLGIPLPKGIVRIYKEGPDGGLEFVGEDQIDHTPKNETLRISTGNAFDIVGERVETNITRGGYERSIEIKIRNRKEESVEVIVAESLYGDWKILESNMDWEKKNAKLVEWTVDLKPDEEKVITYTVLFNR